MKNDEPRRQSTIQDYVKYSQEEGIWSKFIKKWYNYPYWFLGRIYDTNYNVAVHKWWDLWCLYEKRTNIIIKT